jgi:integrase
MAASQRPTALIPTDGRVQLDSRQSPRSVRSTQKHWQPPEGLAPDDVKAVIDAATGERDRLLLRVLWATGARISEALALRPMDVQRDHLVLPNRKNPNLTVKRVYLPAGQADLPGALLVWANEHGLPAQAPLFFSRKRGADGG